MRRVIRAPRRSAFSPGQLDNAGENLRLENAIGGTIVDFDYNDAWYPITVGQGFSLFVLVSTARPDKLLKRKEGWRPSERSGGIPALAITDSILARSSSTKCWPTPNQPGGDAIELYNTTGAAIDIGGWYLSDSATNLTKYRIADGTTLAAGAYLVLREQNHFGVAGNPGVSIPFVFNLLGGELFLTSDDPVNGSPAGYREDKDFGGSELNVSFGRYIKSTGAGAFVGKQSSTLGAANSGPKVGPIVINEIMYHPLLSGDEFIELHNVGGSRCRYSIQRPAEANTWSFTAGVDL